MKDLLERIQKDYENHSVNEIVPFFEELKSMTKTRLQKESADMQANSANLIARSKEIEEFIKLKIG